MILRNRPQCGKFGQMGCTRAHCIGSFTGEVTIGAHAHFVYLPWSNISHPNPHISVFRKPNFRFTPRGTTGYDFTSNRAPFFFEPNFDALIKPLDAALRMQAEDSNFLKPSERKAVKSSYEPIRYGEFLKRKVGNNFSIGKGKYD